MAKNKKPASSSSSYNKKKAMPETSKKPVKKAVTRLNDKKVEIISEKLTRVNKNFECLIAECQSVLKQLLNVPIEV